ncbi:DUF58 domain-containing protein [Pontiella desulfatans]|uniref:DUF58 domain-containing protein n=1 Tax=Pontiella desulfatans TaxID=2750659 RepID=UPI00109CF09E|nr:DUF58 domain-containing protein [Pontiella desulfatans]
MLVATAAVLVPYAVVAAFSPAVFLAGAIGVGGLLLLVLADAAASSRRLVGVEIEAPGIVRLSKRVQGAIELRVKSVGRSFKAIRFGLPLPASVTSDREHFRMALPKADCWYKLKWMVEPIDCGKYVLDSCCLEVPSALGFWWVRRLVPVDSEMRVYPNLRRERKSAAALFLNRGDYGGHLWRQVSKGREFEKLREYIPGDTYQDIHWKTTAKRQHPVTKVYQIERTQEVYVILDSSRLSARRVQVPDTDEQVTLLERYIGSALMLAVAAESQGDLFGLVEFGSKPHLFLKASRGKAHFDTCRNALYTLLPEEASPDFDELVSFVRTRLRKRALLVFLTSLDDAAEAERFKESIPVLSRHHLAIVNMMNPEGASPLFTGEPAGAVAELYGRLGGHIAWRKLHELELHLHNIGVQFNLLDNEHLSADLVTQYMQIKQRQLI